MEGTGQRRSWQEKIFCLSVDVRILSSSSSPPPAERKGKDRCIPKRREMKKPSEIFEGREKGFGDRGRTTGSMKNKRRRWRTTLSWNEERTCYGPFWLLLWNGPSRAAPSWNEPFWLRLWNGPSKGERGSTIGFLRRSRTIKRGTSRRTASSTAVTIPLDRRFPDERGIETLDGIFRESTKKE